MLTMAVNDVNGLDCSISKVANLFARWGHMFECRQAYRLTPISEDHTQQLYWLPASVRWCLARGIVASAEDYYGIL